MRKWYDIVDPKEDNFLVQKWLEDLEDTKGYRIWICEKSWKWPIRALIHRENWRIKEILCWAYGNCEKECPFWVTVMRDQTDFTKEGF